MISLTLEQIAQRRSERLGLGLDFCRKIVQTLPKFFAIAKDGQATLCEKCQREIHVDGRYDYHGEQKCDMCGQRGFCHTITPDYELIQ